jgi:N-dimethylarginine dimethylaminohydrolase
MVGAEAGADAGLAAAARADWVAVCDAIEGAGGVCAVVENDVDSSLTGLPYCAEAGVVGRTLADGRRTFILPQLTPPHRRAEPTVVAHAVCALGLVPVSLPEGVAFEGQGDVIRIGAGSVLTAGVGPWARTSVSAPAHVAALLDGPTLSLRFHADPWFHGNTFLAGFHAGADTLVVVCDDAIADDGSDRLRAFVDGARVVSISREDSLRYATNALQVNDTVLAPEGVSDVVIDAWRALGLTVRSLQLPTLFGKGGGAAVCLTNRLDGVSADAVPEQMSLSSWKGRQP